MYIMNTMLSNFIIIACLMLYAVSVQTSTEEMKSIRKRLNVFGDEDLLIDTPGCKIPNYMKRYNFARRSIAKSINCGARAVFIKVVAEILSFRVNMEQMRIYSDGEDFKCYFRYVKRSNVPGKEDTAVIYTTEQRIDFQRRYILKDDIIKITCSTVANKTLETESRLIYDDIYMTVKKKKIVKAPIKPNGPKSWNVLIIGLDSMSRGRLYSLMPETAQFLTDHGWLDFRGYNKVNEDIYPNLLTLLTGFSQNYLSSLEENEIKSHFIWNAYKRAGYVTAYGEDALLYDKYNTFSYKAAPTDHYMRPLFVSKEIKSVCIKKLTSAQHILKYAVNFADTYKLDNFFGLFWIYSYGRDMERSPSQLDSDVKDALKKLIEKQVSKNTIIILLSDHGIRYGKMRTALIESYYEERLPMLYIRVPQAFKNTYRDEYTNIVNNRNKLVNTYDLYATLRHILNISIEENIRINNNIACPECNGLLHDISPYRTCEKAHIDMKWCSCMLLKEASLKSQSALISLYKAVTDIQHQLKQVKTHTCTACKEQKFVSVYRVHSYKSKRKIYYVIAFRLDTMSFEATVEVKGDIYRVMRPNDTPIIEYSRIAWCALTNYTGSICDCEVSCD